MENYDNTVINDKSQKCQPEFDVRKNRKFLKKEMQINCPKCGFNNIRKKVIDEGNKNINVKIVDLAWGQNKLQARFDQGYSPSSLSIIGSLSRA